MPFFILSEKLKYGEGSERMNIQSVQIDIVDLPTIRPHQLSMHTITMQTIVVAQVRDKEGLVGWSEVATIGGASYGESTPEAIKANAEVYIVPHLIGKDPKQFNRIMHDVSKFVSGNTFAKALIEGALIDLAAKQRQLPAYDLLGGKIHNALPIAWTLASGDTGHDIEEAKELLHQKRHNIFKLKIGVGDAMKNVEHVLKIKEAIGDQARLTVDVNQAWDERTAYYAIEALQDGGVSMIEQPLPKWDFEGMQRLTERFHVSIMADEGANDAHEIFQIAKHRAGSSIALKICKAGGLLATKEVASIARAAGIELYGGTMIESSLGSAIGLHVYATLPDLQFGTELFGPLLFQDTLTTNDIEYRDFQVHIPEGIGFGMTIDEEKLNHYKR